MIWLKGLWKFKKWLGALLLVAIGFAMAWSIQGHRAEVNRLRAVEAQQRAVKAGIDYMSGAMQAALVKAYAQTRAVQAEHQTALAAREQLTQRYEVLQDEINERDFGSCTLSADFVRLLDQISTEANRR